jgi:DNA-binding SARP family transcriptional activator
MEFGLLGPLVVRVGGSRVMVSAGKQRVLLAVLLLRANEVVAPRELAQFLWEGDPPQTARVTLQNYIKRLRQVLGPQGYERIMTRPAGYVIAAGPEELDVARFTELQAAGLAAARAGAWEDASSRLASGLALWRGEPLADVPSPALVEVEVPRLAEMRLDALEARIDADLHLGRHREVVAELQGLTAAEPLRERLHELLMLALYRSGQQAAALAAYLQARRQLIGELGLEPGPGLRDLNQRILQADSALLLGADRAGPAEPPSAGSSSAAPRAASASPAAEAAGRTGNETAVAEDLRPNLLPAAVPGFTGRTQELRALSALRQRAGRPVLITVIGGTAGVGKTALAVHWARQRAARFPDGQLYLNLRGFGPAAPVDPAEALRSLLDALQVPAAQIPATLEGRQSLYRSQLAGKKVLILLDNARDPGQVRPLLPVTSTAMVLVTSRNELTGLIAADGAQPLTIDVLTFAEAREMLTQRLTTSRVTAEPEAAAELIRLCARLPLALAITAARAASRPSFRLASLAAELRDTRSRLDALSTGEDITDARAVFSWSYQQLAPATARMFRLLGLHPGPDITVAAAASLAGVAPSQTQRVLRELTRCHLLAEDTPGRYTLHDLLRAYATEQAETEDSDTGRSVAIRRLVDHYLHTARAAALLFNPTREPVRLADPQPGVTPEPLAGSREAQDWFEAERLVLEGMVSVAAQAELDACAWQLSWAIAEFLDRRGYWPEWAVLQRTALAAAERLNDEVGQATAHRLVAHICSRFGDYEQSRVHLTESLRLYRRLGDHAGQARVHQNLSFACERQGRYADVLAHAEQALELYEAAGNQAGRADALNDVGWGHAMLGDYQRARTFCQQALAANRELGNRGGEAAAWDSVGYAEHQLGRLAEATACYRNSLRLFRQLGDRFYEAEVLGRLGDVRDAAGDQAEARQAWEQALNILADLNHPSAGPIRAKLAQLGARGQSELTSLAGG